MSRIMINPEAILQLNVKLEAQRVKAGHTASGLSSLYVDPRIGARRGIAGRLANARQSARQLEQHIGELSTFIRSAAERYRSAENQLTAYAQNGVRSKPGEKSPWEGLFQKDGNGLPANLPTAFQELLKQSPSDIYEFYDNTVGRGKDFAEALRRTAHAGALALLGFQYSTVKGLRKFELLDNIVAGKLRIPLGSLIKRVEGSKLNAIARVWAYPMSLFRHKDKSLAELIYKKYTKLFPGDVAALTNATRSLKAGLTSASTWAGAMGAVKAHAGAVAKNALRVGKGNAISALVLTAGTEAIGAGISITENYAKYGGNVEKLKEENAKVVGQAVYKTGVVATSSVLGAVAGGALGSLAGPAGTVIGATVGGAIGSWVGDVIYDKTPGIRQGAERLALNFKEQIYSGTEFVADGVRNVKAGLNEVKDHAANLLNGAKGLFAKVKFP